MSNAFTDWAIDQAVDRAMEEVEDLKSQDKILNDDEIEKNLRGSLKIRGLECSVSL